MRFFVTIIASIVSFSSIAYSRNIKWFSQDNIVSYKIKNIQAAINNRKDCALYDDISYYTYGVSYECKDTNKIDSKTLKTYINFLTSKPQKAWTLANTYIINHSWTTLTNFFPNPGLFIAYEVLWGIPYKNWLITIEQEWQDIDISLRYTTIHSGYLYELWSNRHFTYDKWCPSDGKKCNITLYDIDNTNTSFTINSICTPDSCDLSSYFTTYFSKNTKNKALDNEIIDFKKKIDSIYK